MATLADEDEGKVLVDVEGEQLSVVIEVGERGSGEIQACVTRRGSYRDTRLSSH